MANSATAAEGSHKAFSSSLSMNFVVVDLQPPPPLSAPGGAPAQQQ
jgi:hypothetical protein